MGVFLNTHAAMMIRIRFDDVSKIVFDSSSYTLPNDQEGRSNSILVPFYNNWIKSIDPKKCNKLFLAIFVNSAHPNLPLSKFKSMHNFITIVIVQLIIHKTIFEEMILDILTTKFFKSFVLINLLNSFAKFE